MAQTSYSNKINILADLWINFRDEEEFQDFVEYNDLGLPLAYMLAMNIVESTETAEQFINETFNLFLAGMDIEDEGFELLDEILGLE